MNNDNQSPTNDQAFGPALGVIPENKTVSSDEVSDNLTFKPEQAPSPQSQSIPTPVQPNQNGYMASQSGYQSTPMNYQPANQQASANMPTTTSPTAVDASKGKTDYNFDYDNFEGYNNTKAKKNRGLIVFLILLVSCLLVGLVVLSLYSVNVNQVSQTVPSTTQGIISAPSSASETVAPTPPRVYAKGELLTTPEVAEKVIPSVVGILKYETSMYEATGLGSGFIIAEQDGYYYVATNNHVVAQGAGFKVRLDDSRDFDAELVGTDPQTDLAVLRISAKDLIIADIGNSDELRVGETVVAIGNPLDIQLSSSVTQGIVSALNRNLNMENILNYIQTDAAINPGNSGGALVNMYGEVIGINTAKIQGTGLEGIGFALPINEALPILEELIQNGKVESRPVLGITGAEVDEITAYNNKIPVGLMIKEVSPNASFTPELITDDIITHVDGVRVLSISELKVILSKHKIGDTLELTVYRRDTTTGAVDENLKITAKLISPE